MFVSRFASDADGHYLADVPRLLRPTSHEITCRPARSCAAHSGMEAADPRLGGKRITQSALMGLCAKHSRWGDDAPTDSGPVENLEGVPGCRQDARGVHLSKALCIRRAIPHNPKVAMQSRSPAPTAPSVRIGLAPRSAESVRRGAR
jgi:hypothetical protein